MDNKCFNCNNEIENDLFCSNCGLAQKCVKCDTPFYAGEKFCGKCGNERQGPSIQDDNRREPEHTKPETKIQENNPPERETERPRQKTAPFVKWILIAIGIIAIFLIFEPFSLSDEKKIEKTVHEYIKAIDNHNFQAAIDFYHPRSPELEYIRDLDFDYINSYFNLDNIFSIELIRTYDTTISDTSAEITALITYEFKFDDDRGTEELYIELKKIGKDWLIYDLY